MSKKLKIVGYANMPKCKVLTGSALKGLIADIMFAVCINIIDIHTAITVAVIIHTVRIVNKYRIIFRPIILEPTVKFDILVYPELHAFCCCHLFSKLLLVVPDML